MVLVVGHLHFPPFLIEYIKLLFFLPSSDHSHLYYFIQQQNKTLQLSLINFHLFHTIPLKFPPWKKLRKKSWCQSFASLSYESICWLLNVHLKKGKKVLEKYIRGRCEWIWERNHNINLGVWCDMKFFLPSLLLT